MSRNVLDEIDQREVGNRLSSARKQKGLKQADAASLIDVARTTIVAIENGTRRITPEELLILADAYDREVSDFVRPLPAIERAIAQFRGPSFKTNEALETVEPYIELLEEFARNYWELEEMLDKPSRSKYPPVIQDVERGSVATAAEAAAINERNRLGLGDGPLPILRDLLEQEVGLKIFYISFRLAYGFSEIYFFNETLGACIAINSDQPEERRRWSLAHALGHFLAHRHEPSASTEDSEAADSEIFADLFAAYFLIPTSSLTRKYAEITQATRSVTMADLFKLANYYGVSLSALALRLESMGKLTKGAASRLQRRRVKVGDAMQELGLAPIPSNSEVLPLRYRLLAVEAFQRELISEGQLAYFLQVDLVRARRIAELLGEIDFTGDESGTAPERSGQE